MIIIQTKASEQELEEKIIAILRREEINAERISFNSKRTFTFPNLTIDGKIQKVFQNGKEIALTRIEFNLLLFLAYNAGIVFSKKELFSAIWGSNSEDTLKVVANTISNLRKKTRDGISGQTYIHTVRGGYMFSVPQMNL